MSRFGIRSFARFSFVVGLLVSLVGASAESRALAADYARPQLLIDAQSLDRPDAARRFLLLDSRPAADYDREHLPGARHVDAEAWSKEFGDGSDAEGWSRRIGELGVSADSIVVVVDDQPPRSARIWWILKYWGVADVRLLNGGWKLWQAEKRPTTAERPAAPRATEFQARAAKNRLASKDQILAQLRSGRLQMIDARSEGEHCGTEPGKNKRGGAIPGAKHLEWSRLIDPETHKFKTAAQLDALLESTGLDRTRSVATHCQSGGRASVMIFALELMGVEQATNYYRGWSEWGNSDDTPVERSEPKTKAP